MTTFEFFNNLFGKLLLFSFRVQEQVPPLRGIAETRRFRFGRDDSLNESEQPLGGGRVSQRNVTQAGMGSTHSSSVASKVATNR